MKKKLQLASPPQLLSLYAHILQELRRRGVVRSANNPAGGLAEFLVARALRLRLATKSTKGYEALDADGKRYGIKSSRVTAQNTARQLSAIRGLDEHHFDFLAGVLFAENFSVQRACLVPFKVVKQAATYRPHVNAWVLVLRDSIWELEGVCDITALVRARQR